MDAKKQRLVELLGVITCPNAICNFCEHFQNKSACEQHKKEVIADHLIANGAMFQTDCEACGKATIEVITGLQEKIAKLRKTQEWFPSSEPPKENGYYLCVILFSSVGNKKEFRRKVLFWEDNVWIEKPNSFRIEKPLYWMPMAEIPHPPAQEENETPSFNPFTVSTIITIYIKNFVFFV